MESIGRSNGAPPGGTTGAPPGGGTGAPPGGTSGAPPGGSTGAPPGGTVTIKRFLINMDPWPKIKCPWAIKETMKICNLV